MEINFYYSKKMKVNEVNEAKYFLAPKTESTVSIYVGYQ